MVSTFNCAVQSMYACMPIYNIPSADKAPTNITVAVVCSENTNYPGALVEWEVS